MGDAGLQADVVVSPTVCARGPRRLCGFSDGRGRGRLAVEMVSLSDRSMIDAFDITVDAGKEAWEFGVARKPDTAVAISLDEAAVAYGEGFQTGRELGEFGSAVLVPPVLALGLYLRPVGLVLDPGSPIPARHARCCDHAPGLVLVALCFCQVASGTAGGRFGVVAPTQPEVVDGSADGVDLVGYLAQFRGGVGGNGSGRSAVAEKSVRAGSTSLGRYRRGWHRPLLRK
jgi:hypothetical protein